MFSIAMSEKFNFVVSKPIKNIPEFYWRKGTQRARRYAAIAAKYNILQGCFRGDRCVSLRSPRSSYSACFNKTINSSLLKNLAQSRGVLL
jgi:hypothetical protein